MSPKGGKRIPGPGKKLGPAKRVSKPVRKSIILDQAAADALEAMAGGFSENLRRAVAAYLEAHRE